MYYYSLSLYEKAMPDDMELEEKFLTAKDLGYDSVEICIDLNEERAKRLDWSGKRLSGLKRFLGDNGIRENTVSLSLLRGCPLGTLDPAQNRRSFDVLERGAAFTRALDCDIMLINGYDVYDSPSNAETASRFAENIVKAAEITGRYGVIIAIENAEREFIDNFAKAAHWVNRVNSPYFKIYGDVGNSFNAHNGDVESVLADIETGRGITPAVHLKDTTPGEYRFTRFGEGHVDFAATVPKFKDMGVRFFTAELFLRENLDWRAEAARVNGFLRGFFYRKFSV